jgi:hypothetical protein
MQNWFRLLQILKFLQDAHCLPVLAVSGFYVAALGDHLQ